MPAIKRWNTGETILEYEGDLRTAVVDAVRAGKPFVRADLYRADLRGANLSRANLYGADLYRADLRRANLRGANLSGHRIIDAGLRSDGYRFMLIGTSGEWRIQAGCRDFTLDEARKHWSTKYVGEQLGAESLAILAHVEAMAKARGWDLSVPPPVEQKQPA